MRDIASIKRLTRKEIESHSVAFLKQYPQHSDIPVNIEAIADNELEFDIIPLPGLRNQLENAVDAFITSDFKEIWIDQFVYEHRDSRRRFTIAHEIGHMVMHREAYECLDISSLDTRIRGISGIPPHIRSQLEKDADEFAGCVLVPGAALSDVYDEQYAIAVDDALLEYPGLDDIDRAAYIFAVNRELIKNLSKMFEVSETPIKIRLEREGLID